MLIDSDALTGGSQSKSERYEILLRQTAEVLRGEPDPIAWMATLSAMLRGSFDWLWVGFYRRLGSDLVVGPYQGFPACLRIHLGQGVCGTSAETGRSGVVTDAEGTRGHITCEPRSRSEIVGPVWDERDEVRAVLDVDSDKPGAFDEVDRAALETLVQKMRSLAWIDEN